MFLITTKLSTFNGGILLWLVVKIQVQLLSIETTLTYDKDKKFGHASAGKDLALSMVLRRGLTLVKRSWRPTTQSIIGKFMDLDKDGVASYMPSAQPMILREDCSNNRDPVSLIVWRG